MSELLTTKEAKLAWANDLDVEFYSEELNTWFSLKDDVFLSDVFDKRKLRLKPRTIKIGNIEVPAPFEPKVGELYFYLNDEYSCGYGNCLFIGETISFGAWKSEAGIKQVVAALRQVFKGGK